MIKIEAWIDINCPFCYIGKKHLEAAITKFQKTKNNHSKNIEVEWKSFELDPFTMPDKKTDSTDLLARKYGKDRAWAMQMNLNMTKMARASGLDFHLEKMIAANSFHAHRLMHLAASESLANQMCEKLFFAKFCEGLDIGNMTTLKELALSVGLNQDMIIAVMESDKFSDEVRKDEEQATHIGIRGVPFFVFNKEHALSGAQPVEVFEQMLLEASKFVIDPSLF